MSTPQTKDNQMKAAIISQYCSVVMFTEHVHRKA